VSIGAAFGAAFGAERGDEELLIVEVLLAGIVVVDGNVEDGADAGADGAGAAFFMPLFLLLA
jgi:hypothetical protein